MDVNIVLLVTSQLTVINVNLVFLEVSPLVLEQLNVNHALVDTKPPLIEQHVSFVQLVNFLCMGEIVLSAQLEQSVLEQHHVNVLNVDLELKQTPH